jgi:hypothetical protein
MITHNGTYLLHATHHGMPIVAATMGGKMVFGSKWLLPLTLQAIVAAFGAEGTEVIRKTNDYLNAIALTDPQRALQISGFINEYVLIDVDVLYSLIPSMNKIRAMVTSNTQNYIDLGIIPNSETIFEVEFMYPNTAYWAAVGGVRASTGKNAGNFYLAATGAKNMTIAVGSAYYASGTFSALNTIQTSFNKVKISNTGVWINDTNVASFESTISTTNTIRMFRHFPTGNDGRVGVTISNVWVNHDGKDYWYIPVMIDGVAELVDVYSLQLATRSGSFTIQLTDTTPA